MNAPDDLPLEDEYPRTRLTWPVGITALLLFLQGLAAALLTYLFWPPALHYSLDDVTALLSPLATPLAFALLSLIALIAVVLILRLKPSGWAYALCAQVCALCIGLLEFRNGVTTFDSVLLASSLFLLILLHSTDFQRMFREKLEHA